MSSSPPLPPSQPTDPERLFLQLEQTCEEMLGKEVILCAKIIKKFYREQKHTTNPVVQAVLQKYIAHFSFQITQTLNELETSRYNIYILQSRLPVPIKKERGKFQLEIFKPKVPSQDERYLPNESFSDILRRRLEK